MTNLGIKENNMSSTADILHKHLATEIVLNLKIRNFHWNVTWIHFNDLHEFFEKLYNDGAAYADEIAERIRMLWEHTHASMEEFREMRKDILEIAETDDMGTEDFLTGLIQKHEKDAWMLRSLCK